MKKLAMTFCGAALITLSTSPADAAVINLIDIGGVTGSQAELGFNIAAAYWGSILTNDVTINLEVRFASLGAGIIGSTGSTRGDYSVANWQAGVAATKSSSYIDQNLVMPTLTAGGASFITNGTTGLVDDTSKLTYIDGTSTSSQMLYLNSSVAKAIGVDVPSSLVDGRVTFSTNFAFDFNPYDGITAGRMDFIGVAIHEIGHALGFVSGVDFLDVYGLGNSPNAGVLGYSLNDTSIYSALDMFRYSSDPFGIAPGDAPSLDLSVGGTKYFSIDGGATALFDNTMSTGRYNGDGRQASHWKDTPNCQIGNGLLDPTFCYGQMGFITALDLAAYDAMGWNLSVDAMTYKGTSTARIYRDFMGVPEPATWATMIAGFGLVGGMMRRKEKARAAA